MKASPIQPSFSGGEWSPKVQGRVDNERYKTGLAKSLNFIPLVQGPLLRRPGMKYVGSDVKDPSKPPSFLPFQFSQTQNYVLEFGERYIRFFANGGRVITSSTVFQVDGWHTTAFGFYACRGDFRANLGEFVLHSSVISNGGILELPSPYRQTDVSGIKYAQKEDTLYLQHPNYPTYKLQRLGNSFWDLKQIFFKDGPYLPINSYQTVGDSLDISLIPSSAAIGVLSACKDQVETITNATSSGGLVQITTSNSHAYSSGDKVWIGGIVGTTEANNAAYGYWTIDVVNNTNFTLRNSVFSNAYVSGGQVYAALFVHSSTVGVDAWITGTSAVNVYAGRSIGLVGSDGKRYFGFISGVSNSAQAVFKMGDDAGGQALPSTSTITTWQFGVWNRLNGFPNAISFHQDRLALAGAAQFPQRFDLSMISDYEYFSPSDGTDSTFPVLDNNAVSSNVTSDKLNKINWLKSDDKGLLAGSVAAEWVIAPNNQASAITPTNVNSKQTSSFGSHNADAVQTGNATLYIQNGQRRVRELNYFYQVDTFRSTDIAELADHLMLPGITKLVNQKETLPVVWALTTEGQLRSMSYSRDDVTLKVGWAPHQLGGQSDSSGTAPVIQSMAVVPSTDGTFEQLWCATTRFINGTTVCNIEYMSKPFDDEAELEDALCLDLAGTYDSPITISGITKAGSAIVSATSHGLVDGDQVKVTEVVGLNSSYTNAEGVVFNSNLVNGKIFRVGSASTNAFFLQDINNGSSYIDSRAYTQYFSGGEARKLVQTISGFTWLKNETVSVLADGKVHPPIVVNSAGVLTLEYKAAVVQAGYNYNSDGKTLRPEAGSADGSSIGKMRRPYRAAFMLHKTGEMSIGPNFNRLIPLPLENFDPIQADQAQPLFSGIVRESLESGHDFDGQVCFRMNTPLPGMVQTVTVVMESNDV